MSEIIANFTIESRLIVMVTFLLKHSIDLSLLTNGFNIQTEFHELVYSSLPEGVLHHGENRNIKIIIEGEEFSAKLYNIGFDQTKYPGHPDLLQIRYSPTAPIARKLQTIFAEDYKYLLNARKMVGPRKQIRLPKGNHDEIIFSKSMMADVFIIDCIRDEDYNSVYATIHQMNELDFETNFVPMEDPTAGIKEVTGVQRIRQLDKNIGDSLKSLYGFRCQMTGEKVGESYEALVVEAHHIIPFTKSMNNDTSNIIILSPSYHRIIHKVKPKWDTKNLAFCFPNGLVDKVKLNKHLGKDF